jgi:hypothetical protein
MLSLFERTIKDVASDRLANTKAGRFLFDSRVNGNFEGQTVFETSAPS